MIRYFSLESKSLGGCRWPLGHLALALIALVLALEFATELRLPDSALWRIPLGAMT